MKTKVKVDSFASCIGAVAGFIIASFIRALMVCVLLNWLLIPIIGCHPLTIWQVWGGLVLIGIVLRMIGRSKQSADGE